MNTRRSTRQVLCGVSLGVYLASLFISALYDRSPPMQIAAVFVIVFSVLREVL